MTDETKKLYTRKIAEANRTGLIVLVYEIAEIYIEDAIEAYGIKDYAAYKIGCDKAVNCINDLLNALDYTFEISFPLMRIYNFLVQEISLTVVNRDIERLKKCEELLTKLKLSFEELEKQDSSEPVMDNAQTVYAGLTYGKNDINESYQTESNRGYTV